MIRVAAWLAMAAAVAPLAAAQAGTPLDLLQNLTPPPSPICRIPTVVDVMEQEMRANPYYSHIDSSLTQELPTPDPTLVRCYVCLRVLMYDTVQFGNFPIARCEMRFFRVRAIQHGFLVAPGP
ncbi:MAG: hypothetical protein JO110_21035 [Acetobacteraceae bacterium]|nr:hypothetical protein [Acetobacteraceae bacterium]